MRAAMTCQRGTLAGSSRTRIERAPAKTQQREREDREPERLVERIDRNHVRPLRQLDHDEPDRRLHENQQHGRPVEELGEAAPVRGVAL